MSQERLAVAIKVSKSLISAFESGKLIPQVDTAEDLDKLYGTGDEIQRHAKETREDLRPWLRPWVEHEREAVLLRSWEPMLIPGLLQREGYMRELFAGTYGDTTRVDEFVETRLARQSAALNRNPPVTLSCLIGEFALRQGSREILKDQLDYLIDVGHRPNVRIRVVPDGLGLHVGLGGPISLATMPDGRRLGYLDDQLRGRVATTAGDVIELELFWELIDALALSVDQSRDKILRLIDEFK